MTESRGVPEPLLPAHYPRTATQLLLAQDAPFEFSRTQVTAARLAIIELIEFLPAAQHEVRAQFERLDRQLEQFEGNLRHWTFDGAEFGSIRAKPPLGQEWVEPGAPVARVPVPRRHAEEPVFGFAPAYAEVLADLAGTVHAMSMSSARRTGLMQALYLAGRAAHGAQRARHLTAMFSAAVWDFERPAMPALPSAAGRIELRPSPRAVPQTRWARFARLLFTRGRVEVTTADGHEVIGVPEPIAYLMHVAPPRPTTTEYLADPAERYAPVPRFDDLGAVHFCTQSGYSMGAVAVADWLAQPDLLVRQPALTGAEVTELSQHANVVWALEASGIVAGAAVLDVPIRRGVAHPPPLSLPAPATTTPQWWPARLRKGASSDDASPAAGRREDRPTGGPADDEPAGGRRTPVPADPLPAVRMLRPAPHLLPRRGLAATRKHAIGRRTKRQFEVGPASPLQPWLQRLAPIAVAWGAADLALSDQSGWFTWIVVGLALLAAAEPWVWWVGHWLVDRDWRTMVAVYHPGASEHASKQFAQRAELRFDGANIGVRGASGHEVWIAGSSDEDLGAVALVRLHHKDTTWGFAFADRAGRWRVVLPAAEWAPGGDLSGLAAFAGAAGLSLVDLHAEPGSFEDDPFTGRGSERLRRSRGPRTRAMIWLTCWAVGMFVLTVAAPGSAQVGFLLAVATLAGGPVLLRWAIRRWWRGGA
mgnify:FL=1